MMILGIFFCGISHAEKLLAFNTLKTVYVSENSPEFTLTLPSAPSTGYSWEIKSYNKSFINFIHADNRPSKSQLAGAKGKTIFYFRINRKIFKNFKSSSQIITFLRLSYARPWQPDDHPSDLTIKIIIQKN